MFDLEAAAAKIPGNDRSGILHLGPCDTGWREVHRYKPTSRDGHEAAVYVVRMPAAAWRVHCPTLGLDLATGTGMHDLAGRIAEAIAGGMLAPDR